MLAEIIPYLRSSMYPGVPPTDKVYEVITDITRKYRNILGHSFPFWHGPTTAEELWEDSKVPTQLQLKNTWKTAGKSVWKPKRWRSECLGISHHAFLGGWKLKSKGGNVLQKEKAYSMKDKIIKDQLLMNVVISFFSTVLVANSSKKKKSLQHSLLVISAGNSKWVNFKCGWQSAKKPWGAQGSWGCAMLNFNPLTLTDLVVSEKIIASLMEMKDCLTVFFPLPLDAWQPARQAET